MARAGVIGLGANLGRALATLTQATEQIAEFAPIRAYSRVYQSAPVGRRQQPDFLNAAVRIETSIDPATLVALLHQIERRLGRVRRQRWGPRVLDLDLLWMAGVRLDRRDLTLPHPRLEQRAFALLPLSEVAPDAREPRFGRPYTCFTGDVQGQRLRPIRAPLPWLGPACAVPSMDSSRRGW
jgi:2-amino-4-hydroxy-6-hydroxymethyldihydropteridine diphosphokinase